ncbi:ribosomal RNA small subunit methyltransferase I [Thermosipho melanesiensis]|uniref:Ribosomal RNA small subunit methyltransferase I n=2 Tax=Thermosipho melanesiensis TaxID=46541 RepID=A6LJQ0_THEM4|nr:16S rRNA (cytidine(1402)-2'-O)-methyltransferase [Thermosipho melanesiensis]ABR30151.1 Uroporphyrin-III C/tetrapyrrole (Corrin/Porphyrin) methyltransferase [Thermosipho melanesiensis BI429]APT73350.1 tetrapyrrole methylase [Thermosipho melanesiensis]OOC38165.1 ribosomal RNA small subunit methyltransferase I [Thermosipho melanesiensis]OOC40086.1 ribosomal RNA small subunit methyltransferase I [Thermosipho melanesiensis]OOC40139.1 ribosomal RNA small subunit methyltransferase I [Thermosipho m
MLYIVGTPIGNLEDITLRALKMLKEGDYIFAEDTRRALKLLNFFSIKKPLDSFNEHSSKRKLEKISKLLKEGKNVVYLSDAGMPVIADPGAELVNLCYKNNIPWDVIPGVSALTTAVTASGFYGNRFLFLGFMPRDKKRRRLLRSIKELDVEIFVFFENPERLNKTLVDIQNILGNVEIFIARELTKVHQEYFKGIVSEALIRFSEKTKGEITVVLKKI